MEEIAKLVSRTQYTQHTRTKERQIRKFTTLLAKHNPSGTNPFSNHDTSLSDSQWEKWVKNLSDRELTQTEEEVLSKGLNFLVTPEEVLTVELITATETAIRNNKLPEAEAEQIRLKVTATLASATSNITNEEKRAIASLAKDKNITILPADKGRCTVLLNTTDYDTKILSLLTDTATYEKLKRDPTSSYKKKVVDLLQKLEKDKAIDRPQYYRLYPGETIPCIYGLPKIHKPGTPLRPIVSSINSVTYNISKYLASILSPMVGNTPHHIKNSQDFAQKVSGLTLLPEETMVSYDVTSLFTCIPTASAIDTIHKDLLLDKNLTERTTLTPAQICTMLDLCLNTTYFQYREGFYRQKHGCAMGSPVSPIVANLYMEKVESQALTSFTGTAPSHWFRYVDDTWVKIQTQELEAFSDHLNKTDEHVKFTREDVKGNSLAFLDCAVKITEDRNLTIEVYRKPTHTDQYLQFDSHHPLEHKLGVIRTLQHRAREIPTTSQGRKKEQDHIKTALKTCGYPDWAFTKTSRKPDPSKGEEERNKRCSVSIPYLSGISEKFRRILQKHDIPVHFKPSNTLRWRLVHPKDKTPRPKQSNVVHAVQCQEKCKELYIGETKQPLHRRMAQRRHTTSSGQDSAVHLHLKESGHSFEDSQVRILSREDRWFERGVKEAIHVKLEKPSLNRGGGLRHFLSPTYNAVLHSFQQQNKHSHHSRRPSDSSPCDPADKGETPQQKLGERPDQRPC
ncbi:hypothetical protein D4764_05G0011110 [Takifugu flavidus]|uniref:Reverse transcriptase domain-containing protein n=2 Tax=Takifugu flavidus TaxID=433684 RepID=A0A5C6N3U0_9TELE|nr:hypothetical protein D4764_05G0011110 [Takifugu flavidus]